MPHRHHSNAAKLQRQHDPDANLQTREPYTYDTWKHVYEARKSGKWCDRCNRGFKNFEDLMIHRLSSNRCSFCNQCFRDVYTKDYNRNTADLHSKWTNRHQTQYCMICGDNFRNRNALSQNSDIITPVCLRCFENKEHIYHRKIARDHQNYYCPRCQFHLSEMPPSPKHISNGYAWTDSSSSDQKLSQDEHPKAEINRKESRGNRCDFNTTNRHEVPEHETREGRQRVPKN